MRGSFLLFLIGTVCSCDAFGSNSYLSSLTPPADNNKEGNGNTRKEPQQYKEEQHGQRTYVREEAPDEWYGKSNPMASWGGWKDARWGGYLDNLQQQPEDGGSSSAFEKGKQSDYGDDVRWGTEVYLNSIASE